MALTESEAIELGRRYLLQQGRQQVCDGARYFSTEPMEARSRQKVEMGIDDSSIDLSGNPWARSDPHWSVMFRIDHGPDCVGDPSHNILLVFDDKEVVEFPVL
ncbi:MAG: hypothetical protein AAGJ38_00985 [Planctomycetota bacterium]